MWHQQHVSPFQAGLPLTCYLSQEPTLLFSPSFLSLRVFPRGKTRTEKQESLLLIAGHLRDLEKHSASDRWDFTVPKVPPEC